MKPDAARQTNLFSPLATAIEQSRASLWNDQLSDGTWWYTLEANESIGAGYIQLMHFLGEVDAAVQSALADRILSEQRADGSWALFYDGPADLSVTVECYLALRLAGFSADHPALKQAQNAILKLGGIDSVRVFTKIHLALFGLVPWSECPSMPVWLIKMPLWSGGSIYEFSSWARASIVPLLVVLDKKPVVPVDFDLDELNLPLPPLCQRGGLRGGFFQTLDIFFKFLEKLPLHPGKAAALKACEQWIRGHIARTEDIYPAMAYGAMAIRALGFTIEDPTIRKAMGGLKRFQQVDENPPNPPLTKGGQGGFVHQQCCISPLWDTPWACRALLESGVPAEDSALLKAARHLVGKQIREVEGDWAMKNPGIPPGGWAFEFQNDFFPDVDDTIEILRFLKRCDLPPGEKEEPIRRGLNWLLSMQSKNGGWAAFDKNNLSRWVNRIPFSDHGACLDPPTPDITGRAIELLADFGHDKSSPAVRPAIRFLHNSQEDFGAWRGRWGVNFIYGTWAVLQGLERIGIDMRSGEVSKAVGWLLSIQNPDGGWGESCLSDRENRYVPLGVSVPSQTAWAVMGLVAAGEADLSACRRGIDWLIENQTDDGRWEERHFTGTGFPGHFYIRYHGYRQYFPLLALSRYKNVTSCV